MVIPPHTIHKSLVKDFNQYDRYLININSHLLLDFQYSSPILKDNITFQKTNGNYMYSFDSSSFQKTVSILNDIVKKIEEGKYIHSFTFERLPLISIGKCPPIKVCAQFLFVHTFPQK